MVFVITCIGNEARSDDGSIVGRDGARYVLAEEEWVDATGVTYGEEFPPDAITFRTGLEACDFAKRWKPHPWWVVPREFEIFEVREVLVAKVTGYVKVDGAKWRVLKEGDADNDDRS